MTNIVIPYKPRPLQQQLHDNLKRFSIIVCHRRFGKSVFAINELIVQCLNCSLPRPRVAYIGPTFPQVERTIWDYAKYYTSVIPNININNTKLRIDLPNEGRIELISAERPDNIRGAYFDAVVLDEYSEMNPLIWSQVVRPTLSDREGKAIFIGTPKGANDFYKRYQIALSQPDKWFAAMFKASETQILSKDELSDARLDMSEEEYEQEFECSWTAAIKGSYYGRYLEKISDHIMKVPLYPGIAVNTAWDIGVSDSTSIWFFQKVGMEIHIIDFYQNNGEGLQHYAKVLQDKKYVYGTHYGPHDMEHREFASQGKSRKRIARELGLDFTIVKNHNINDGIEVARNLLARCYFDEDRCYEGLEALKNYHQDWKDRDKTFTDRPHHDWSSHAADAFRYLAMGLPSTNIQNRASDLNRRGRRVSGWAS